jgi:hypothetical protein
MWSIMLNKGFDVLRVIRPDAREEPAGFFDLMEVSQEYRRSAEASLRSSAFASLLFVEVYKNLFNSHRRGFSNPSEPEAGECRISSEMWQEKTEGLLPNSSELFD